MKTSKMKTKTVTAMMNAKGGRGGAYTEKDKWGAAIFLSEMEAIKMMTMEGRGEGVVFLITVFSVNQFIQYRLIKRRQRCRYFTRLV